MNPLINRFHNSFFSTGAFLFFFTMFFMEVEPKVDVEIHPTPKIPSDQGHDNRVFADERGVPHLARPASNATRQPTYIHNIENSHL